MSTNFVSAVTRPSAGERPSYWFIFNRFGLLVHDDGASVRIPYLSGSGRDALQLKPAREQYLGYIDQDTGAIDCYSGEVTAATEAPPGMAFRGLRQLFGRLDDSTLAIAGRAVQIVEWDRTHQFCGQCGAAVQLMQYERAKKCPVCSHTTYPRLAPAIIVSVERPADSGTELLLARNQRHPEGLFSVLAGFVEPGESLEECVRREVCEEVGIEVKNIQYFGSQPWPFPNSLMIAFTAEYAGGQISLEDAEIAEAGWFRPDNLPRVPPPVSIARQLIDAFVRRNSHLSD